MKKLCFMLLVFTHLLGCGKDIQKDEKTALNHSNESSEVESKSTSSDDAEELIKHILNCDIIYLTSKINQYGVNPNYISKTGERLIVLAAKTGKVQFINFLVEQGADISLKNSSGESALTIAAREGHNDLVSVIINHGADINTRTLKRKTSLYLAIKNGNEKLANSLIIAGADTSNIDGRQNKAMTYARVLKLSSTKKLLKDVQEVTKEGNSINLLNSIVKEGRFDSLEFIISHYDINETIQGNNFINNVVEIKDTLIKNKVLSLLIKYNISMNPTTEDIHVPLITAVKNEDENTVRTLLNAGAKVDSLDNFNKTALHYALRNFSYEMSKTLIFAGAATSYNVQYGNKIYKYNNCKLLPNITRKPEHIKNQIRYLKYIMDC